MLHQRLNGYARKEKIIKETTVTGQLGCTVPQIEKRKSFHFLLKTISHWETTENWDTLFFGNFQPLLVNDIF